MNDPKAKPKYVNKTFRLRSDYLNRMEVTAAKAHMSTNGLITSIIERYLEWNASADVVRFLALPPNMINGILTHVTESEMAESGEYVAQHSCFKDLSLHLFQEYNPDTFTRLLIFFDRYANTYKLQGDKTKTGGVNISLYHDYGKKWSLFLSNLLHGELLRLGIDNHTYETSDNAVVFSFPDGEITLPPEYLEKFDDE